MPPFITSTSPSLSEFESNERCAAFFEFGIVSEAGACKAVTFADLPFFSVFHGFPRRLFPEEPPFFSRSAFFKSSSGMRAFLSATSYLACLFEYASSEISSSEDSSPPSSFTALMIDLALFF